MHELARKERAVGDGGYVADERLAETRGELGSVVAHLVGVGKDNVRGAFLFDELLRGRE